MSTIGKAASGSPDVHWDPVTDFDSKPKLGWGWRPDLDIQDAVGRLEHVAVARAQVLISMVDSTPRVGDMLSLKMRLSELGASARIVGCDVATEGKALLSLIESGFFTGFDEVWLFDDPPRSPKPGALRLTSDAPLRGPPPEQLEDWMRSCGCYAGLGDGDGLNFVTFRPALADVWGA
jgi:hypothetical protein